MWVQIAIIIVSMILSYSTRQKPTKPDPAKASAPTTDEGLSRRRIYGTVWIDDSIVLGFKEIGTDPIRTKGGKK